MTGVISGAGHACSLGHLISIMVLYVEVDIASTLIFLWCVLFSIYLVFITYLFYLVRYIVNVDRHCFQVSCFHDVFTKTREVHVFIGYMKGVKMKGLDVSYIYPGLGSYFLGRIEGISPKGMRMTSQVDLRWLEVKFNRGLMTNEGDMDTLNLGKTLKGWGGNDPIRTPFSVLISVIQW